MSEYMDNINTDSYRNNARIYVKEITGQNREFIPLKLTLNSSNFNFDTVRQNGYDLRFTETQNGTNVLQMWIAYWDYSVRKATVWFKLPSLFANEIKVLYAFWGKDGDTGESDIRYMFGESVGDSPTSTPVFLFGDDFNGSTLDSSKWSSSGSFSISNSELNLGVNSYVQSIEVLPNVENSGWLIEEGVICNSSYTNNTYYAHRYAIYGGENELSIIYYAITKRYHNFEDGGSAVVYNGTNRGLESGSYSQNYIAYYEDTDKVYQGMRNRETYIDYNDEWERKVHRNTDASYFRIYGKNNTLGRGVRIDWVIVREYDPNSDPEVDLSELYIPYENIPHQSLDFTEYTSDITNTDYYHLSDMGGDPYKMSDNITNSASNIFISDTTTSGNLIIDFGRKKTNLVDNWYLHFDNNHVNYYNASKLSDLDEDIYNRNYWQCTTSSGVWAAIKFPNPIMVGCLSVTAVADNLNGMIKNFKFYGCNTDPRFVETSEKYLLAEGIFSKVSTEQTVYFTTNSRIFDYYILEGNSSYGSNIVLQEWGMYELRPDTGKKVVSQLRLHPVAFESNESYFPKEIKFYGSNNMLDWIQLIDTTKTYTPFIDATYGRWQRYSFDNEAAYYNYKLVCIDNWYAQYDIIKIAEWEMVTKLIEEDTFRILNGSLDNINNIWADNTATFENGNVYITNDKLNVVMHDTLIESTTVSGVVSDINVRV